VNSKTTDDPAGLRTNGTGKKTPLDFLAKKLDSLQATHAVFVKGFRVSGAALDILLVDLKCMSKKSNVCVQFSLPDISPDEILLDCTLRLVLANQKQNHRISYQQSQQFMYIGESVHLCISRDNDNDSRTVEPLVAFLAVLARFLQYSSYP
jgi:hypothetical protein